MSWPYYVDCDSQQKRSKVKVRGGKSGKDPKIDTKKIREASSGK